MYDCKLMELGERSLWSGWAAGRSFFVVEGGGGWRMTDAGETGAGWLRASSGAASRLPEFC